MAGGIPVSLSFGPWAQVTLFGKNIFELLDFVTSNLMMPLFGLALTLLLGWQLGLRALPRAGTRTGAPLLMGCWRWLAPCSSAASWCGVWCRPGGWVLRSATDPDVESAGLTLHQNL